MPAEPPAGTAVADGVDWHDVETGHGLPPDLDQPYRAASRPDLPDLGAPTADAACQAERARVLRYPDIAARLCERPLRYSRAEVWNGYVPPAIWQEQHNDSPYRAALIEIITEAVAREKEEREAADAGSE